MCRCRLHGLKLRQTAGGHAPEAGNTWVRHQEELFAWKGCKTAAFFFFLIRDSCHFGERTNDFLRDSLKAQPPKEKKSSVEVSYIYGSMARYRWCLGTWVMVLFCDERHALRVVIANTSHLLPLCLALCSTLTNLNPHSHAEMWIHPSWSHCTNENAVKWHGPHLMSPGPGFQPSRRLFSLQSYFFFFRLEL